MMTKEELKALSKDELFEYFCQNARFAEGVGRYQYEIMTDDGLLTDCDTFELRKKFENWVGS